MTLRKIIICTVAVAALCGCGDRNKAEGVVNDFLEENLTVDDYSVSFARFDSTLHVTDSVVAVMRANADANNMFRHGISYAPTGRQYKYVQAAIITGNDTVRHTFYLNPELTRVVAFK